MHKTSSNTKQTVWKEEIKKNMVVTRNYKEIEKVI